MTIVTEYIEKLVPAEKAFFSHLRQLVYEVVPEAEDSFSYGIPTYKYKGKYMIAFASNKKFLSIYPGAEVISVFKKELEPFKLSKGTISFTPENPLPDALLRKIILRSRDAIQERTQ
jgi:uncharacterized protein YdhG (YjbR/CyaY superfamily)